MIRLITATVATFCLLGCSSAPVPVSQAELPSADRIYSTEFSTGVPDSQKITVVRGNHTMVSAGRRYAVWVDGKKLAALSPGEKISAYLPVGEHLLSVGFNTDSAPTEGNAVGAVVHVPTKFPIYRTGTDGTAAIQLVPATE